MAGEQHAWSTGKSDISDRFLHATLYDYRKVAVPHLTVIDIARLYNHNHCLAAKGTLTHAIRKLRPRRGQRRPRRVRVMSVMTMMSGRDRRERLRDGEGGFRGLEEEVHVDWIGGSFVMGI